MVTYAEVFRPGHGPLPCKVCDQCARREHVDMVGWHGHHKLEDYWFCSLACLHDAEGGVFPTIFHDVALRDLPRPPADPDGWRHV